jgi:hypothetical protein
MSLLNQLRQTLAGAVVIRDWLGEGGNPVPQTLAESRAAICVNCPENRQPNWWDIHKDKIALAIRKMLAFKNDCEMRVNSEYKIQMCRVCGCCLRLKVWTPITHIRDNVPQEALDKAPDYCWMRGELGQ